MKTKAREHLDRASSILRRAEVSRTNVASEPTLFVSPAKAAAAVTEARRFVAVVITLLP